MNLFTSPLILRFVEKTYSDLIIELAEKINKARIEKMIAEIYNQRAENVLKRKGISHKAEEISKLIMEDSRLDAQLKILKEALRK